MDEIKNGDFVSVKYQDYIGIDIFVINSINIQTRESEYVISCQNPIDPSDKLILVKISDKLYFDYPIEIGSVIFERYDHKKLSQLTSVNITKIPLIYRRLIGKKYPSPRGDIEITIPLLSKIVRKYPESVEDIDIKKYPEKFFMDLYDIHPMEPFNDKEYEDEDEDLDLHDLLGRYEYKYGELLEKHAELSSKFSKEGKYKYLEKVFDDIPSDERGALYEMFSNFFNDDLESPIMVRFVEGVEFESKEKVLNMLIEYSILSPEMLFDIKDSDVVDIIISRELEKNGGENSFLTGIGDKVINMLIFHYNKIGDLISEPGIDNIVDTLRNLGNHRDILFRDSSQEDIERLLDNLLQSYNEFKKVNNLISEGDDTDVLMKTLIKRIRDSNMTKSALKR